MKPMARWILDLHDDFPSSRVLLPFLREPVVLERDDVLKGRWPDLEGPLVGYGTMFTMTRLRRHAQLSRAVFDDYGLLRCSSYYRWNYDLLKRTCLLVPLSALPNLPLRRMFDSDRVFVRSDTNYKLFPAAVHQLSELPDFLRCYANYQDELAVLSEVVQIDREYRCFCRQGKYVCGSSYPEAPFLQPPAQVRQLAELVAARLLGRGLPLVSIDVAECGDGQLRLVEIGGVNSWGLYGTDPEAFVAALEAQADEEQ